MKRICPCAGALLLFLVVLATAGCSKSSRAGRAIREADRDFAAGKYDSAEAEYRNALHIGGMNANAIGQLGRIYAMDGRFNEAGQLLFRAAKMEPKNIPFQVSLAEVYVALHGLSNAATIAMHVLAVEPTNEDALLLAVNNAGPVPETWRQLESMPGVPENPSWPIVQGLLSIRERKMDDAGKYLSQAVAANPKSSQAYFAMAEYQVLRQNEKGAAEALQNAAAYAPIRSAIRTKYVDYLFKKGDLDQAWKVLDEMTSQAPDYLPAWVSSMNLALAQKKFDQAAKCADFILARDERNYDGLMGRATINLAKGDAPKALLQFQQMESLYKRSPQVKYQIALAYLTQRDKAKAIEYLNKALTLDPVHAQSALLAAQLDIRGGDAASAAALLNRFIKKAPNVGQAYFLLADAYLAEQKTDSALAVYRSLAESNPKNAQVWLMMGMVHAGERRYSDARADFEKSVALAPDYLAATEQLINLDVFEQKFKDAAALAQAQVNKSPKAAEPWVLMAKIDVAQTNLPRAENDLLKAIDLNPDLPGPYLALAQVYFKGTNYVPALQKLTALVARTNDPTAFLEIGAIHEQLKQFDEARDAYEKVLAINNHSIPALNNLAYIYAVRLNKLDKAFDLAQQARQLQPYDAHVEDTLGWILFKQGDYPHALTLLEDGAERSPTDAEIQFHLGMTHYMMDEEDSARVALQRAVAPGQDYVSKDEALNALAVLNMDTGAAGPAGLAGLKKALKDHPNDPVILNRIGALQEQQGAVEDAAETYESALKKNPDAVHMMARLARLYDSRLNKPDKAWDLANEAHKMAPDSAEVNGILGHCVFDRGDYTWALSLLENAADRLPNRAELLHDLAWAYYAVGRTADGQIAMQKALRLGLNKAESEDAKQFVTLTDALGTMSKIQAAVPLAQKILAANPKHVPAMMVTGLAAEQAGNFKAAKEAYAQALSIYPQFVIAARQLALLDAAHFTDDSTGRDWAEKARNAYPDDPAVAKSLAILSYYQTQYPRSAEILQETIAKDRADGELYYYLGMNYYQLKRKTDSKKALDHALTLRLPENLASQARQTLAQLKGS